MSFKAAQDLGEGNGNLSANVDPAVAASEYQRTIPY
jgi:hypothetical protein